MKDLARRQIQTIFALSSKKAQPPNWPRLAAGAKIVILQVNIGVFALE